MCWFITLRRKVGTFARGKIECYTRLGISSPGLHKHSLQGHVKVRARESGLVHTCVGIVITRNPCGHNL